MQAAGDPERPNAAKSRKTCGWLFECIVALLIIALLIILLAINEKDHVGSHPNSLNEQFAPDRDSDARLCAATWRSSPSRGLQQRRHAFVELASFAPAILPQVFSLPTREKAKKPHVTHYQVFTGGGAIFQVGPESRPLSLQRISTADGTSKTLLVVEADSPVPWTQPEDLPYSPDQPLPKLGGLFRDGFNVLMADGSVRRFPKDIHEKTIRAAITWNGGEVVNLPE